MMRGSILPAAESLRAEFSQRFGGQARLYRAPGRINIIGEHTDYNEGRVLPCAIDLYTWAAATPGRNGRLRVHFQNTDSTHETELHAIARDQPGQPLEYVKGVVWALQAEGCPLPGGDLLLGGNIPLGGGLSSSASLELVVAKALLDLAGIPMDHAHMARLCRRAEAEFVGLQCGIMDQYAVALSTPGQALMLDCRSLDCEHIPLPEDGNFLVVHSGVSHRLPTGGYNSRREECREAVERLGKALPELGSLRDLDEGLLEANRSLLDDRLYRRCRHVVRENARVMRARRALLAGDLPGLGALLDESHASLRDDFEVSCAELDRLVDIARRQPGVLGSRMMGGGFGGCAISLVEKDRMQAAAAAIARAYGAVLGSEPWMHIVGPAGPVTEWEE